MMFCCDSKHPNINTARYSTGGPMTQDQILLVINTETTVLTQN